MEASRQRQEGFERAVARAGLKPDAALIAQGSFQQSGGRLATRALLDRNPTLDAIFCANDFMAAGCYEALAQRGLRVGHDIAVMGYDDLEIAQHLEPPLSTVLLPHAEMGRRAIDLLLDPGPIEPRQIRLECPLVLRESHGAAR